MEGKFYSFNSIQLAEPKEQTVSWNPSEYKIISLDLKKGELKLEKVKSDERG